MNLDELKNKALDVAQVAAQKTKDYAAIAKARMAIATEREHIRRAQQELGKLYYRDYVLEEEADTAEYLPWCDKITESRTTIEELKAIIEDLKNGTPVAAEEPQAEEIQPEA